MTAAGGEEVRYVPHRAGDPDCELRGAEPLDPLTRERTILCDVLQGRTFRLHAARFLEQAVYVVSLGVPEEVVTDMVDRAERCEWIAQQTEWGNILYGQRRSRDGLSPEYPEDEA